MLRACCIAEHVIFDPGQILSLIPRAASCLSVKSEKYIRQGRCLYRLTSGLMIPAVTPRGRAASSIMKCRLQSRDVTAVPSGVDFAIDHLYTLDLSQ